MQDFMQSVELPVNEAKSKAAMLIPSKITSFTTPKASHTYNCEACGEPIIEGCKHDRIGYDDNGTMRTVRAHINCFEVQAIKQGIGAN